MNISTKEYHDFEEEEKWAQRLFEWKQKVEEFDTNLDEQLESLKPKKKKSKYNLDENTKGFYGAYPVLGKLCTKTGFIHHSGELCPVRKRFPIYKSELYYPPPHFRAPKTKTKPKKDGFSKWMLHQKIVYSHPDYKLKKGFRLTE